MCVIAWRYINLFKQQPVSVYADVHYSVSQKLDASINITLITNELIH